MGIEAQTAGTDAKVTDMKAKSVVFMVVIHLLPLIQMKRVVIFQKQKQVVGAMDAMEVLDCNHISFIDFLM